MALVILAGVAGTGLVVAIGAFVLVLTGAVEVDGATVEALPRSLFLLEQPAVKTVASARVRIATVVLLFRIATSSSYFSLLAK
ncbi:MAG: hypothetical protein JKY65_23120 [Planctomycetes bacterium]|nr:hypothetical protein [Planctomycetota bacterium]